MGHKKAVLVLGSQNLGIIIINLPQHTRFEQAKRLFRKTVIREGSGRIWGSKPHSQMGQQTVLKGKTTKRQLLITFR